MLKEDKYINKLNLIKTRDKREGILFFQPFFIFYTNSKNKLPHNPYFLLLTTQDANRRQTAEKLRNL